MKMLPSPRRSTTFAASQAIAWQPGTENRPCLRHGLGINYQAMPTTSNGAALRTWFAVVRAYLACERRYARLLSHFGLTIPQFDALTALERRGGEATPAQLAESLMVTRGNVTGLIRRMQARKLLAIEPHPDDARSVRCVVTPVAKVRMTRARIPAAAFIADQMAPFDAAALADTERRMNQMCAHLDTLDGDAIAARVAPPTPRSSVRRREAGR